MTSFFWSNLSWFVLAGMLIVSFLLVVAWKVYRSLPIREKESAKKSASRPTPQVVDLSKMAEVYAKVYEYKVAYKKIGAFLDSLKEGVDGHKG